MTWWGRYVGIPYGEGDGCLTCWGLVRAAYAECLDVELPSYGEISARDLIRVARAMATGKDDGWQRVAVPDEYDVALMCSTRGGRAVVHVGIMVDNYRMAHVEQGSSVSVVPVRHPMVAHRILGYRRYAA